MFLSLLLFESSTADVFELALSCKIDWKNQTSEKIEIWLKNQLENYQEFAANLWWKIDQKKTKKKQNQKTINKKMAGNRQKFNWILVLKFG